VLEREKRDHPAIPDRPVWFYTVRHLERFALGTPYPDVTAVMKDSFDKEPLTRTPLVIDHSGVGIAAYDFMGKSGIDAKLIPVCITAG
jgi:hypothetical protein